MLAPLFLAAQLVLWHSYRAEEQRALDDCVTSWNQSHATKIEALALPYDGFAGKLESAIPRGNGPDLFIAPNESIGDWQKAGLILPIDKLVPASVLSELADATLESLRVDHRLYGLPLAQKSLALFYRTDKITAPPRTTDELVRLAERIRRKEGRGHYALAYEAGNFFNHAAWLSGYGGRILDDNGRPELASSASVRSVAFVARLAAEDYLPAESTAVVATQLFNDGRAAMTINGPWFIGEIARGVPFAVAPLPIVSETGRPAAPLSTVEALMLPARGHDAAAALAFAGWLTGHDAARVRALVGRQVVATRSVWDDPAVARDPILAAFHQQLAASVPLSNAVEMRQVWEPAQQALRKVLRGDAPAPAAMAEAQRKVEEALRPPPRPAPIAPYLVGLGLLSLFGGALLVRRQRGARGDASGVLVWPYLLPSVTAMLVLVFVPFSIGAAMSLFSYDAGRWTFIGFSNFADILGAHNAPLDDPLNFYFSLVVTALWTLVNVVLHVAIGVFLALLLRDPLLRLRGVYRVLLIVPWAVPNYITALIWKGMFHRQFGAINGLLALLGIAPVSWFSKFWTSFTANVATNVWLGFPFMMVVTLGALSRIPKELEEAAALDGATRRQRLFSIILPLLKPALLPAVMLGAVWTFNMFNIVFLVSGGEPDGATDILVSQAYRWAFSRGHRYGYAAAYAVLIFAILAAQMFARKKEDDA